MKMLASAIKAMAEMGYEPGRLLSEVRLAMDECGAPGYARVADQLQDFIDNGCENMQPEDFAEEGGSHEGVCSRCDTWDPFLICGDCAREEPQTPVENRPPTA